MIALHGFEPWSQPPEGRMIGRYTTGLYFFLCFALCLYILLLSSFFMDKTLEHLLFPERLSKYIDLYDVDDILPVVALVDSSYFVGKEHISPDFPAFEVRSRPEITVDGLLLPAAKAVVSYDNFIVYGVSPVMNDVDALTYIRMLHELADSTRSAYDSKRLLFSSSVAFAGGIVGLGVSSIVSTTEEIIGFSGALGLLVGGMLGYNLQERFNPGSWTKKYKEQSSQLMDLWSVHKPVLDTAYLKSQNDLMVNHKKSFVLNNLQANLPEIDNNLVESFYEVIVENPDLDTALEIIESTNVRDMSVNAIIDLMNDLASKSHIFKAMYQEKYLLALE